MIRIKNEGDRARVRGVTPEIVLAINIAYSAWVDMLAFGERVLRPPDMVITSLGEIGDFRKKGSKHLSGNAFDIRTRDLVTAQKIIFLDNLKDALGDDYDVVLESNHIHVEYDPEP